MSLTRITTPADLPVTLAYFKTHLRTESGVVYEDALMNDLYLPAATEQAEHILQRSLMLQQWQVTLDAFPAGAIKLQKLPVVQIDSIKYNDVNGTEQTLSASAYALDKLGDLEHWAVPAYSADWPSTRDQINAVRVLYTAGYAAAGATITQQQQAVPAPIKAWICLKAAELYENREASSVGATAATHAFVDRMLDRYRIPAV
jgi:uncharacterized phiE125 gp8 family phage protein